MRRVLVVGATSGIAHACSRLWAAEQAEFFLVARNPEKLAQNARDLAARGAYAVHTQVSDLNRFEGHEALIDACFVRMKSLDIALIAYGTLPDQRACERDPLLTIEAFSSNGLGAIALLTTLANRMEAQGNGTLAVISSVAGDRGRPSNYVYGAAKSSLTVFCSGLRARLYKSGVHVLTIKPGFVDTPMTEGLPLPAPLVSSADAVARIIHRAIDKRRDEIYTPGFWRLIMLIIRSIPIAVFKRLDL